ncbi:MFS transporter [Actinoalloteichus sp. AHMU CJ021]|uniref:MFS transporter n=1 Tax=Actinoalloteichus TaxID=65496 RepID=UPI0004AB68EE|nr:MFS transporter [Actinoalloteichus caeruleus]AUS77070.1 MFS transporter [Actinoalloteichus sp. AHMU CJ021]
MVAPVAEHPTPPPDQGRPLRRDPAFLRLWCGATLSGLATWALPFLLGFAVVDGTLGVGQLGVVLAARTVGFLAAVPVGGVLADRHSRRATVLWSGLAATAATPLVVVGLGWSTTVTAIAAAVVGCGQGACRPAYQALTAEVVVEERRQRANAAMSLAVRGTTLAAPGLTAMLAVLLDTSALILGTALMWLGAALLPPAGASAPPARAEAGRSASVVGEFLDGLREARRHPWFLAGLAALSAVIATGYSATGVILPLVSRDHYDGEFVLVAATTGYTLGALGFAVVVARWRPRSPGWASLFGLGLYGFAPLAMMLEAPPAAVVLAYVLAGVGIELFNVLWFTAIQREVEPRLLARVSSVDFLFSYGLAPVGLALITPAVAAGGVSTTLAVCAVVCFLAPALAACAPGARGYSRRSVDR